MAQYWHGPPPRRPDWRKLGSFLAVVIVGSACITGVWWGISKAAGW